MYTEEYMKQNIMYSKLIRFFIENDQISKISHEENGNSPSEQDQVKDNVSILQQDQAGVSNDFKEIF
jgi:hypothetical protein